MQASDKLSLILTGVACGCCVFLCIAVTYLCVVVKRIRRKLNDLSGDGTKNLVRAIKKSKDEEKRLSTGPRYIVDPQAAPQRVPSAVYQDPQETVTRMDREAGEVPIFPQALEPSSSTQNITEGAEKSEQMPLQTLQFVNEGFNADRTRDSTGERSSEAGDSQPIYGNQEVFLEERISENNNDESIYQNAGELRSINNPEWARSNTLDKSQIP